MPDQPKSPHRTLRVDEDKWPRFKDAVERSEAASWSDIVRQFMDWYAREPGAKLPKRPDR